MKNPRPQFLLLFALPVFVAILMLIELDSQELSLEHEERMRQMREVNQRGKIHAYLHDRVVLRSMLEMARHEGYMECEKRHQRQIVQIAPRPSYPYLIDPAESVPLSIYWHDN